MADMMRITTVPIEDRQGWVKLQDWLKKYSEQELVEALHRYSDTQENAKNYRQRAQSVQKLMREAIVREAKAKGVTIADYIKGTAGGSRVDVTNGRVEGKTE